MSRSTRGSITRRRSAAPALVILLFAWFAPGALADPAGGEPDAGPRFPIERITVEGARHASAELIVAESLLTEGRGYTEAELRQAVYRIKRLPFVIDTRFALRKGSERGRYELVITVEETSLAFLGLDVDNSYYYSSIDGGSWIGQGQGTVGARWFTGRQGVLFGAVQGDQAQVGYTHYDLFGRRVFATFVYGRSSQRYDGLRFEWDTLESRFGSPADLSADAERFTLLTGFPLTRNQSLRFSARSSEVERDEDAFFVDGVLSNRSRERSADVQWIFDSTDDPVLTTRGRLANFGVVARRGTLRGETLVSPAPALGTGDFERGQVRQEVEDLSLVLGLRLYRPLSSRQTIWFAGEAAVTETSLEQRFEDLGGVFELSATGTSFEAGGGYALSVWEPGAHRRLGDLRFETTLRLRYVDVDASRAGGTDDGVSTVGGVGLVLRNRWGLFRFGINVQDLSGSD